MILSKLYSGLALSCNATKYFFSKKLLELRNFLCEIYSNHIINYIVMSKELNSVPDFSYHRRKSEMYYFRPYKMTEIEAINSNLGIHHPSPRSGHRIVTANGNIYCFGGYNPITVLDNIQHLLFKELWVFNCVSKTWKLLESTDDAPDELASHCATYVNNHLLIFGGTAYPFGAKSSNDVHICNLKTLQWSKLETEGSPPPKQYGQAMALDGNNVYVVGGTSGYAYSNEVHCLNLLTKEWKQLSQSTSQNHSRSTYEPEPRYRHEIAIKNNKIFVFGGGTAAESFALSELPVFNLLNNTWEKIATSGNAPAPRRCHSCVQVENEVYVCGGLNGIQSFKDIFRINLETLVWEELEVSLPYPLYFHAATLSDSYQLFIFGGVNGEKNQRTCDLYTMFLKIPSLSTICWQAVLHYVPNIALLEKGKLFEAGVPMRFLNEVEFACSTDNSSTNINAVSYPDPSDIDWEVL